MAGELPGELVPCPRCGTGVRPSRTSCPACGAVLAPRASMDGFSMFGEQKPIPTTVQPPEPSRGRGRALLVAVLVLALLVAGSATALALRGHRHDSGRAADPVSTPTSSAPTASHSPHASPTPTRTPEPPPPVRFRCWDGTVRKTLSACGSPYDASSGAAHPLAGLDWVFVDRQPRLEAAHAACEDVGGQSRTLHLECLLTLDGQQVCLHYSQFLTSADALADYSRLTGPQDRTVAGGGLVRTWPPQASGGCPGLTYKTARIVVGQRWGLSAYADSAATAAAALGRFGPFRDVTQWRGVRAKG